MSMTPQEARVLVVDDDVTANRMLQAILGRAGFRTDAAYSAAEAFAHLRQTTADLVLLDVNLPDGKGTDICRQLQGVPGAGHTPILFISANGDLASKVRGFEAGGVDYIPKPFAAEEVIARVRTHLRLKQAYESLAELHAERIQRLALAQERLMPPPAELPEARFEVAVRQVLSAGGDFYDVVPVAGQIVDYVVADASGHDLAASFWTAALKTLVSEYATPVNSPQEIVQGMNGALCRILPPGVYFTVVYARLNRKIGRLYVVSAGHPPALVTSDRQTEAAVIDLAGDVVGAFPDATFDSVEIAVQPGDRLFLYSDGLIELKGSRQEGIDRLRQFSKACQSEPLNAAVQSIVQDITAGLQLQDDIVFMGVEV